MQLILFPMLKLITGQEGGGPYLQFLTHFVSFDIPEWLLLEQVDECELLCELLCLFFLTVKNGISSQKGKIIRILQISFQ